MRLLNQFDGSKFFNKYGPYILICYVLLVLICVSNVFATQQSFSGSLKALTIASTDTLIANGNITIDTSATFKALWMPSGQTYTIATSGSGRVLTLTGPGIALKDSTSGTATFPDTIKITGNASVRISSGIGTIGFKTLWVWSGTTDTMVCLKAGSFWGHRILTGCTLLETGANNITYRAEAGNAIRIDSAATYTNNNNLNIRTGVNGRAHYQHPNGTWSGTGAITIGSATGINCNDTIGYLNRTTGNLTLSMGGSGNYYIDGNITATGRTVSINTGGSLTVKTWFLNGANLDCSAFTVGASLAGSTNIFHAGSGIFNIASFNSSTLNTGASMIDSLGSAKFIVAGNWTNGSNHTVVPGSSSVIISSASSITSDGEHFYNLKDSIGNVTFADVPYIENDFVALSGSSGNITWSGFLLTCGGNVNLASSGTLNLGNGITFTGSNKIWTMASTLGAVTGTNSVITWNGPGGILTANKDFTLKTWTNGASGDCSFNGSGKTTIANGTTSVILGSGTVLPNSFSLDDANFTCQSATLKSYGNFTLGTQAFNRGTSKLFFYGATNSTVTANGNRFYDRVDSMDNGKKVIQGDNQYHNTHVIKNGSFDFNGKIDTVLDDFSVTNLSGDTVSAMGSGSTLVLTKPNTVNLSLLGTGRKRLDSLSIYIQKNIVIASDSNFAIKKIITANHGGTKYTFPCNKQVSLFRPVDYDFSGTGTRDTFTSTAACSLAYVLLVNGDKRDSALYVKNISVSGGSLICSTNCIDGGGNSGVLFGAQPVVIDTPLIDSVRPYMPSILMAAQKRGATFKIRGRGFKATQGTGTIYLGSSDLLTVAYWSDTLIIDTIPISWTPKGVYNLIVKNSSNLRDTSQIRVLIPTINRMNP